MSNFLDFRTNFSTIFHHHHLLLLRQQQHHQLQLLNKLNTFVKMIIFCAAIDVDFEPSEGRNMETDVIQGEMELISDSVVCEEGSPFSPELARILVVEVVDELITRRKDAKQ